MLKLSSARKMTLLNSPESGMGFQLVEATMADNTVETGVAYNAVLLLFESEPRTKLLGETYTRLAAMAESSEGQVKAIRVVPRSNAMRSGAVVRESFSYGAPGRPAKDAPKEPSKSGAIFKRFSAFADDNRIRPDKSLLPGTYATTEEDARNVRTGRDAVARYALPNPSPASNVFTIMPLGGTSVQRGTVQPDYGQPGGGVEVIFTDGTHPATVSGPIKIPD